MIYLKSFDLLSDEEEYNIICKMKNIHETLYPLKIFPEKELRHITFEPITIFGGGNGSGKTTLLQVIAAKLHASIRNHVSFGELFDQYAAYCKIEMAYQKPNDVKMILSDDVFDYLLDIRAINSGVNRRKAQLSEDYRSYKNTPASRYTSLGQYEELKNKVDANRMTASKYIRSRMNHTIQQSSNGETALNFWVTEIEENSLYLIDEPENSLSCQNQIKLKQFIEDSARFYHCQFILATHSPFLLGMTGARIYDLDEIPVKTKRWTDLKNVRTYYDFFQSKKEEFEAE